MICESTKSGVRNFFEYLRLNDRWAFKESEYVRELTGKQYELIDTRADDVGRLVSGWREIVRKFKDDDIEKVKRGEEVSHFKEFQREMTATIASIAKAGTVKFNETVFAATDDAFTYNFLRKPQGDKSVVYPNGKKQEGIIDKLFTRDDGTVDEAEAAEFATLLRLALRTYAEAGYDMQALFRTMNHGDFVENLLSVTQGHFRLSIAEAVGKSLKDGEKYLPESLQSRFKALVKQKMTGEGVGFTEKQLTNLVDDMLGNSLVTGNMKKVNRFVMELRGLYGIIQLFLGGNGWLFLSQSCLIGKPHQLARQISSENLGNHALGEYLMKDLNFLNSEKVYEVEKTVLDGYGDTWTYNGIQWLSNKLLRNLDKVDPAIRGQVETIVRGGWHNWWDIMIAPTAKRDAIGQALGKLGITQQNADKFLADMKAGKHPPELIRKLRSDANVMFADFRTASDTLALSRNVFSKNFFLNIRASYLINRCGDIIYGINSTVKAIQDGKIKSYDDFLYHLDTNEELRTLLINTILSAKVAAYVDRYYEDKDAEGDKADRMVGYWNGLNDYYAALTANLPVRLILGPLNDTQQYVRFMDAYGKEVTLTGMLDAAAYNYLNALTRTFFKEAQALDPLFEAGKALAAGQDLAVVFATMDTHYDRIKNSAGRFGLMEGQEPYGLRKFPETDDYFNSLLMTVSESNQSMDRLMELRNVENMEKLMQKKTFAYMSLLKNFNSIPKWFVKDWSSGEVFDRIRDDLVEKDPVMKDVWNGKWNPNVIRDDRVVNGVVVKGNVDSLFKELTALNVPGMPIDTDKLKDAGDYGLNKAKKEAFENEMLRLIDRDDLVRKVTEWNAAGEDRTAGLIELMAYSEAKKPGTSRLMLSYLADKYYTNLSQKYYVEGMGMSPREAQYEFSDKLVPEDIRNIHKKAVLNEFYPSMYVADKTSWTRLAQERMNALHPKVKISPEQQTFLSALGMLDLMAYSEAKSGNPNAHFVKNAFAFVGKYVENPVARMFLANRAMDSIDAVAGHPDVASAAKLGFVAGNVDVIDKMLRDPEMSSKHRKSLEYSMDKIFGTLADLNAKGSEHVRKDVSDEANRYYSKSTGKNFFPSRFANRNSRTKDDVDDKIPQLLSRLPSGYTPSNLSRSGYDPGAKYSSFTPKLANGQTYSEWYAKVYAQALGTAESKALVTGYVERSPEDGKKGQAFRLSAKAPKLPKAKAQFFDKKRARYAYKTSPFEG